MHKFWFAPILLASLLLISATSRAAYIDEVNADNPMAYYRFEDATSNDGAVARDQTGNHHGTYSNDVSRVPGVPLIGGLAANFSDLNPKRYVAQPDSLDDFAVGMADGYGIELWVRTNDTADDKPVLGTLADNGTDHTGFSIELNRRGDNFNTQSRRTLFFLRDHSPNGDNFDDFSFHIDHTDPANIDIYDGRWHHVFWNATDPSNHQAEVYIDGQSQSLTIGRTQSPDLGDPFQYDPFIGNRNLRGGPADPGPVADIDEVAFYADALPPHRIQTHYATGTPEPNASLLLLIALGGLLLHRRRSLRGS
jgi:hypothetical protein